MKQTTKKSVSKKQKTLSIEEQMKKLTAATTITIPKGDEAIVALVDDLQFALALLEGVSREDIVIDHANQFPLMRVNEGLNKLQLMLADKQSDLEELLDGDDIQDPTLNLLGIKAYSLIAKLREDKLQEVLDEIYAKRTGSK